MGGVTASHCYCSHELKTSVGTRWRPQILWSAWRTAFVWELSSNMKSSHVVYSTSPRKTDTWRTIRWPLFTPTCTSRCPIHLQVISRICAEKHAILAEFGHVAPRVSTLDPITRRNYCGTYKWQYLLISNHFPFRSKLDLSSNFKWPTIPTTLI